MTLAILEVPSPVSGLIEKLFRLVFGHALRHTVFGPLQRVLIKRVTTEPGRDTVRQC